MDIICKLDANEIQRS